MIEVKDWMAKLGLGSVVGWFANNLWRSYQKRIDCGRRRVDDARPELVPLGTSAAVTAGAGYLRIRLTNSGVGVAQRLCLTMSHCVREACGGEIQAEADGQTEELNFEDQPVYRERKEMPLNIVVSYLDRFENSYKTIIPFSQEERADRKFNINVVDWKNYKIIGPVISNRRYWKIGK